MSTNKPATQQSNSQNNTNQAIKDFGNGITVDANATGIASQMQVYLNGQQYSLQVAENETLLQAMLNANIKAPYNCRAGVCGVCKCRVTYKSGSKIAMKTSKALTDDEVQAGFILACQSLAQSEKIVIEDPY